MTQAGIRASRLAVKRKEKEKEKKKELRGLHRV